MKQRMIDSKEEGRTNETASTGKWANSGVGIINGGELEIWGFNEQLFNWRMNPLLQRRDDLTKKE